MRNCLQCSAYSRGPVRVRQKQFLSPSVPSTWTVNSPRPSIAFLNTDSTLATTFSTLA